jgi:putative salt-induced outer membrane protein YdiY
MQKIAVLLMLTIFPLAAIGQEPPSPPPPPPAGEEQPAEEAPPPEDPPVKAWSSSLGGGFAVTSGNRDTRTLNFSASTEWDPKERHRFKGEALYLRGEAEGVDQVDKATASARHELLLSERTFVFSQISYLRDPFKDLEYVISPVAGGGRHLIRTDLRRLTIDGAVGGQFENRISLCEEAGVALRAGESFEWQISPSSRLTQKLEGQWKASDLGDALYHFDAGLATTIAARMELKISYLYDYRTEVPPGFEEGDSALFAAVVLKF